MQWIDQDPVNTDAERDARAIAAIETMPLWVLDDILRHGRHDAALVVGAKGEVFGLVRQVTVSEWSEKMPEAPLKVLPLERAVVSLKSR
ncbi:MAG: hypothetical protein U0228_30045 [Myxococcaceae bacterium]